MSLKKVLKKVFATQIVVSMLYSNFYLCGLGIANVIAQDIKEPKIVTNLENIQYVQFNEKMDMKNNEEEAIYKSGVAIKSKLEVALEEQEQELQLPIKGTELVIGLPVMNGYLPVRANVVRANTILTTGEENKNINQNYDLNSGLLTMSIQNQVAYSKYNKDSKDEFEIIYIYPAEAYTGNEEEKVLQYLAKIKTIFETENGEITSEKVQGFELKEKDNKGELVEFNITKLENPIYKGFMYSNIENGTKYETDYNTTSTLSVLNHDIEENLVMEIKENNFVLNNDKNSEISTSGRTIYKSTQIDKEQFDKILGQDGIIEIYNGENLLATVSYIAVNEKEEIVNKLAVIYSDDDIKILTPEEKIAKIEYGENITSLLIKTTKPIAEGYLNFKNQNAIIAANDYIVSVEDIKSIKTVSVVNEIVRDAEMLLFEPETKVKVNSSNMNFSTLKINKTTLTINLDSTNVATKLFDNPILEIELPEGIVSGNVSSPSIINGNGLKIKGDVKQGKASNIIIIELEGKQTKYNLKNVSGGTAIVMDIENLDYEDTIPAHIDTISVTCIQEDEKVVAKQDVNIVSKAGLFMFSKTNINNITETATNINGEIKEISISEDENKKQMKQTVCFVNNYGNDLENFQVIGRLAYSDSKFNSTIDVNLSKEIVVDKEGAEVYYSANQNADYNDASWSKEFNKESKAYKVVLKDNKLLKEDNLFVDIYAEIPEQLGYNQTIALKTQGIYSYNNSLMEENIITKMVTPRVEHMIYSTTHSEKTKVAENLPIEIGTTALIGGEEITEETVVNEGQIIRYIVSLKNNSNEKISSIDLKTQIKNAVYYELGVIGYSSLNSGEGSKGYVEAGVNDVIRNNTLELEPNETKTINYQIVVGAGINSVENLIVISKDNNIIYENNVINNVKESRIKLKLKSVDNEEVLAYSESMHSFIIEVTNLTTNDIKNVKAYCILPPEISYDIENWEEYFLGNQAENFDNIYMRDNILYFDINTLSAGRTNNLYIWAKIGSIENNISKKDVSLVARVEENGNIYTSNDLIKTIHQSNYNLISNMTSITPVEKTLKNGDEIIFKVTMENGGMLTVEKASLNMKTSVGIKLNKYVNSRNGKEILLDKSKTLVVTDIELKAKEKVEFMIYGIIDAESALNNNVDVSANVNDGVNIIRLDSLNYKIEKDTDIIIKEEPEQDEDESQGEDSEGENDDGEGESEVPEIIKPELEEPGTDDPGTDDPGTDDPGTDAPGTDDPGTDDPGTDDPGTDDPGTDDPGTDDPGTDDSGTDDPEIPTYTISGVAWEDLDKDGIRSVDEIFKQGVVVSLIDVESGNFAVDANGNKITTITNEQGKYVFNGIPEGEYAVMFEFNTEEYTVTTYQKEGVNQTENSDVILSTVTIDGKTIKVGITDSIELDSNIENLDIGLIQNAIFDLRLDKNITEIIVIDEQGVEEYTYEDGHTAKVDLVAKYMNGANVVVNYRFTITNDGEVTGYVDSLVDSLPSGLEFNSEVNVDWYKGSDGRLYTKSLSAIPIQPGESTEIDLVLTKTMTEDNAGTFVNSASLEKISNLENIQEKEDALEGNESSAILIISIKTGSFILYLGITMLCLAIIGIGVYFINKKIITEKL